MALTINSSSTSSTTTVTDEIVKDHKILEMKHKVMNRLKWSALLSNTSDALKYVAGPLLTIGATLAITGLTGAAGAIGFVPAAILVAGGVALAAAVGTGFAATRIFQGGQFDNFEINAQSTARHLVQELKTHSMSREETHDMGRADGKSWVQAVRPQMAEQQVTPQVQS